MSGTIKMAHNPMGFLIVFDHIDLTYLWLQFVISKKVIVFWILEK
jgi:hypothetical protein